MPAYKDNWEETRKRYEAYWEKDYVDRCMLAMTIPDLQREAKLTLVSSVSIVEGGYHDVTLRSASPVK